MEEGEEWSAYFSRLKNMTRLRDGVGLEHRSKERMLEVVATFYLELYAAHLEEPEAMQQCLQELTWTLAEDEQQKLEEEWMLEEAERTLFNFRNGKTPQTDGLPKESYVAFWDQVGPDLLEVFQEQLQEGHA
ncbi:hypothetical protein Y1Q_0012180 [Alligator mississippiensis]|uniref:Uncharacterized protein n=1 Tax=Alligator mississippiensis TaxID=8496 RepID=A0A151N575_ALLMI|nr:hypothetical protein Y1Q_0012180 [Alligator mississippiensis]